MTAPELKPCPFCGGNASCNVTSDEGQQNDYDTVGCSACPAEMRIILHWADDDGKNKADLLSAWNRRADLAQPARVRVKPLVWNGADHFCSAHSVKLGLSYSILRQDGSWHVSVLTGTHSSTVANNCNNLDAAKAAAQADYEARILAAIEPLPDPRDEVIARLVEALEMMRSTYPYNPPCFGWQEQIEAHKAAKVALAAAKAVMK